jgi:hypothetical protein
MSGDHSRVGATTVCRPTASLVTAAPLALSPPAPQHRQRVHTAVDLPLMRREPGWCHFARTASPTRQDPFSWQPRRGDDLFAAVWRAGVVTSTLSESALRATVGTGARERRARACAAHIVRSGSAATVLLMVLPGLLSSSPVENSLTGAAVGLPTTLSIAACTYLWHSYLVPYWDIRTLVRDGDPTPKEIWLDVTVTQPVEGTASLIDDGSVCDVGRPTVARRSRTGHRDLLHL